MKGTRVRISQLQEASQRLQGQIENLRTQVRLPELPRPSLVLPLCQGPRQVCVQV